MSIYIQMIAVFLAACSSSMLFGEDVISPVSEPLVPPAVELDNSRFYIELIKMLGLLAVVIGIMILISWLLKKAVATRLTQMNDSSSIKVLETRALSSKTSVFILEVQDRNILVVESQAGGSALLDITPKNSFKDAFDGIKS